MCGFKGSIKDFNFAVGKHLLTTKLKGLINFFIKYITVNCFTYKYVFLICWLCWQRKTANLKEQSQETDMFSKVYFKYYLNMGSDEIQHLKKKLFLLYYISARSTIHAIVSFLAWILLQIMKMLDEKPLTLPFSVSGRFSSVPAVQSPNVHRNWFQGIYSASLHRLVDRFSGIDSWAP